MQQREEWWAILAEGNQVAKEESKRILGNKRSQVFHKVFIDSTKAKTLKVTVDELAQIACISVERKEKIRAAHKVEGLAWDSQKRLMFKLARKYAFRLGWVGEKLEDLIGEAEVAFCKCVRGYSDPNFSFGAYMGMAIMTELRRYVNRNRGGLGKANAKLLEQYNNKKEELEKAGLTSTFDDVVCAMGLGNDREKRRRLWGSIQVPVHESNFGEEESVGLSEVAGKERRQIDVELLKAISMVKLTQLERDAWLSGNEVRGLFPQSCESLKEVGERNGVSTECARIAKLRANEAIKSHLVSMFGEEVTTIGM